MKVRVYAVDQDTAEETFEGERWLTDIIDTEESREEYEATAARLAKVGSTYVGGGAAQLFLLYRA